MVLHQADLMAAFGSVTGRYSPAEWISARKHRVEGYPDIAHVRTSYVERQNLTKRMSPAMATGIADRLRSLEDVVAKIDELAPTPKARGPYKKRAV